jgi:hypothetical protein
VAYYRASTDTPRWGDVFEKRECRSPLRVNLGVELVGRVDFEEYEKACNEAGEVV